MKKLYIIERRKNSVIDSPEYRFNSLANGSRGLWHFSKESAEEEGEEHQAILQAMYPRLEDLLEE